MAGKKGMHRQRQLDPDVAERIRQRILSSKIAQRLVDVMEGKLEMSATQAQVSIALLRKVLPDLQATEITQKGRTWVDELRDIQASIKQREAKPDAVLPAPSAPDHTVTH